MKKYAFIVSILGISVLLTLLLVVPEEITENSMDAMEINEKIYLEGVINKELDYGDFKILELEIDGESSRLIDVVCDCKESYLEKKVSVIGVVEEYEGEKQVRVLSIMEVVE